MKYICVTHVDSRTGVPCNRAPMKNGPAFPDVKGFQHEWHDESRWPLTHPDQYPRFFGTCDDDADLDLDGVVFVFEDSTRENEDGTTTTTTAQEKYEEARAQEMKARLPSVASPMRIRLALLEMGLLEQIQTHVESLEEPIKSKIYIMWEYSTEVRKNHPAIQKLAEQLNIDEDTLDQIFVKATELSEDPFAEPKENNGEV